MVNPGPFTRAQLAERGIDARQLRELLEQGRLRRVHRGWYADAFTPEAAVRAVQLGGRLGCLSACHVHGLWVPPYSDLHVVMSPGARPSPAPPRGVQFHRLASPCPTAVAPVEDSVAHVLHRHDEETALVVLESAVNLKLLHEAVARHLLRTVPMRSRRTEAHYSGLAQSGSETRLRLFFQRRGVYVRPQAYIAGIGHVDLLVGKSWIIEADSAAHHSAPRNVAIDCARDFAARERGYVRDRLSYEQIWLTWDKTQGWLLSILRTGRHLALPVPLA
ncbi:MAG: type IV toxin-antitoxin system AbiEi family antitoxin domain-containing protein [Dermatophilus congolensis]|nr:type IV toxin-antitoxin system AbiEi family antitoxin domain-containing protein [Dermatophilus congolensis]